MRQCAIFDSPEADARLIGVKYIISEKLFDTLSDEEKKQWHSHDYEVKGGILFMPGVLRAIESRVGFSSCREFPKQSREKSLKRYKCLAFEPAEFLHESWKKSSSTVVESS
jgi:hypothetical protein